MMQRNFREMVTKQTYVDKSLLIRDLYRSNYIKSIAFIYPGCGKSLNLSMLRHFFARMVDGVETCNLFTHLSISKYPDLMQEQGEYAVIYIDLNDEKAHNKEQVTEILMKKIKALYQEHDYLLVGDYVRKYY